MSNPGQRLSLFYTPQHPCSAALSAPRLWLRARVTLPAPRGAGRSARGASAVKFGQSASLRWCLQSGLPLFSSPSATFASLQVKNSPAGFVPWAHRHIPAPGAWLGLPCLHPLGEHERGHFSAGRRSGGSSYRCATGNTDRKYTILTQTTPVPHPDPLPGLSG